MPARFSTSRSGCRAARGAASANQDNGSVVVVAVTVPVAVLVLFVTVAATCPGWRTVMLHVTGRHVVVARRHRDDRARDVAHEDPGTVRARRRKPVALVGHVVDAVV